MTVRSLAEMRALLGDAGVAMTDADVLALRDDAYAFAQVLVRSYTASRQAGAPVAPALQPRAAAASRRRPRGSLKRSA